MATPLPTQRPAARSAAPSRSGSSLNLALLVLLLATMGAGGYGWVNLNGRIKTLEAKPPGATVTPRGPIGTTAMQPGMAPTNNFATTGGPGTTGRGGRGGRGGGGAAGTAQRLGLELNEAQLTQLDSLTSARMLAMREDPYADLSSIDGQIADIVGAENLTSFTNTGRGGRGGRGGGGGGPGGGGAGGFGPGGGGGGAP